MGDQAICALDTPLDPRCTPCRSTPIDATLHPGDSACVCTDDAPTYPVDGLAFSCPFARVYHSSVAQSSAGS